jgi:hypothetical protein
MVMKISKRATMIFSIAAAAAIASTFISMNILASAAPTFVSGKLIVVRAPDDSEVVQNTTLRTQFSPISLPVLDLNPKLKEAIAGADTNYDIYSRYQGSRYQDIIVREPAYEVAITEQEANLLMSNLPLVSQDQKIYDEGIVKYNNAQIQLGGKVYHIAIIVVAK